MTLSVQPSTAFVPWGFFVPPTTDQRDSNERIGMMLRNARKKAWGNRGSLARTAEMAGVSTALLSMIERGDHPLSSVRPDALRKFPAAYGLSAQHFAELTGLTLIMPSEKSDTIIPTAGLISNVHRVPVRSLVATGDSFFSEAFIINHQYVPDEYYRPEMIAAQVIDSSMSPALCRGDYVLVDQAVTEIEDSRIYLLMLTTGTYVLRRCRVLLGNTIFVADDPAYDAISPDGVKVIGLAYRRQPEGDSL